MQEQKREAHLPLMEVEIAPQLDKDRIKGWLMWIEWYSYWHILFPDLISNLVFTGAFGL